MAFGATLTITVNSVAKVLNRINQDNYGSEYLLRGPTDEFRMKIRHSKENPKPDGSRLDRHNVELTHTVFKTSTTPEIVRVVGTTIRVPYNDDLTLAGYDLAAFCTYMNGATPQADVLTWQS